jgi:hypothetical protein
MMEHLPPAFNKQQMISDLEMKDLLEFAIPTIWCMKMAKHAFRPIEHDIPDIVEFCERLEYSTESAQQKPTQSGGRDAEQTSSQSHKGKNSKRGQYGQDNMDALMPAVSNSSAKKHKRPGSVVSCKDSNGNDGHCLHIWAAEHMMAYCHVISKQTKLITCVLNGRQICRISIKDRKQTINSPNREATYMS